MYLLICEACEHFCIFEVRGWIFVMNCFITIEYRSQPDSLVSPAPVKDNCRGFVLSAVIFLAGVCNFYTHELFYFCEYFY